MKVFRLLRDKNHKDDMVAKLAIFKIEEMPTNIFIEVVQTSCTDKMMVGTLEERQDWQTPILQFLKDNILTQI